MASSAIDAALASGITIFDHADLYCDGRSEAVFGEALAGMSGIRERLIIATKCGIRLSTDGGPYRFDSSRSYILQQCDASLKRLRTDTIDLFQIHRPDWLMEPEEVARAFDELHAAGKVRTFGLSNFSTSQARLLASACRERLVVHQIEISLCQPSPLMNGLLDQCMQENWIPLAWSPLGGGLLAGNPSDLLPHQKGYAIDALLPVLDEIAMNHHASREQIALAWLLRHPSGIVPIIGTTRPDRIQSLAAAASIRLGREDWYRVLTAALPEPLP